MKISLVMTTYNGELYVKKQLDSLLKQSRSFDEVIISDDGSHDNTCEIIKNFINENKLDNWRLRMNEAIHGYIGNFLATIEETSGDLIFLCDQDDEWEPCKVEVMSSIMMKNSKIKALNTAVHLIDSESNDLKIPLKKNHCNANFVDKDIKENKLVRMELERVIFKNISPGCTVCFDKSIKENLLGKGAELTKEKFPHDWYINCIAALNDGLYFYNRELTRYRIHSNNTIGINVEYLKNEDNSALKFREGSNHRLMVAERIQGLFDCFYVTANQYIDLKQKTIRKIQYIVNGRVHFCQNFSFLRWLKLLRHLGTYIKIAGTKSVIGDLIFALKLDSFFMKK